MMWGSVSFAQKWQLLYDRHCSIAFTICFLFEIFFGNTFNESCLYNAWQHIINICNTLRHTMNTLLIHYRWLWLELTLTLLVTVIIWHYRRTVTHYKYVHNALEKDALSKVLPFSLLWASNRRSRSRKKTLGAALFLQAATCCCRCSLLVESNRKKTLTPRKKCPADTGPDGRRLQNLENLLLENHRETHHHKFKQ